MKEMLELLKDNSRLSTKEISVMLEENEEDVKKEIKNYENKGIIKAYHTLIDWEKTDTPTATALIELKVTPKKDTGFDEVAGRIMNLPEVESVYLMSGGYDLAVTVVGKTMQDIAIFVAKRLSTIDGVLSTSTHFVLTKYKDGGVIFHSENEEIDERGSNLCD